jgi:predicted ester cyclase
MILEQLMTGTVIGSLPGLPGNGRRISFRIVHVFEFRKRPAQPPERFAR